MYNPVPHLFCNNRHSAGSSYLPGASVEKSALTTASVIFVVIVARFIHIFDAVLKARTILHCKVLTSRLHSSATGGILGCKSAASRCLHLSTRNTQPCESNSRFLGLPDGARYTDNLNDARLIHRFGEARGEG